LEQGTAGFRFNRARTAAPKRGPASDCCVGAAARLATRGGALPSAATALCPNRDRAAVSLDDDDEEDEEGAKDEDEAEDEEDEDG
jgi:hypothetical protein